MRFQKSLFRSTLGVQIMPRLSLAFSYSSQGPKRPKNNFLTGRYNHDAVPCPLYFMGEGKYYPSVAVGLRDFVGTGWYSSEYIVGSKTFGDFEFSAGMGFGRLAGRNTIRNPLGFVSSRFRTRGENSVGVGGTVSSYMNWFSGEAGLFAGATYKPSERLSFSAEYTSDVMDYESIYVDVKSPLNLGISYKYKNSFTLSGQYLYGSEFSLTASVFLNPKRPPNKAGLELAPVPMRQRNTKEYSVVSTDKETIYKVLKVDGFKIKKLEQNDNLIRIDVVNTKFRSIAKLLVG